MMDKIRINKRDGNFYPYSIEYMGREEVLLKEKELVDVYRQIEKIIEEDDLEL